MSASPIRILHMIASLEIGGSQAFVMNLYRKIDKSKIQFDFIIDHTHDMHHAKEIEELGGKIFTLPTFKGKNLVQVRKAWDGFFREHPEYKILHSHSRSYASIYFPIAKKHGVKTIIHSHSTSNGKGVSAIVKAMLQYPLRFQADYFMACSKEAGEWLFGKKVCKGRNYQVIKNAIDVEKLIFSEEKRKKTRNELGLDDEFVLGFLARVMPPKNPLFVLEIFNELKLIKQNAKLLFVGDGDLLSDVKARVEELGLMDDVIFTGARGDVDNMLCTMDYYILPSLWEGLGISLIEAQASGLRCICSENIQQEAIITDLVTQMQLADGACEWASKINELADYTRENNCETIKAANYDISLNGQMITNFYLKLKTD